MKIGKKTSIHMGLKIFAPWKIVLGDNSVINYNVTLDGRRGITIENNIDVAANSQLLTLEHDIQSEDYQTKGSPIILKNYCCLYS